MEGKLLTRYNELMEGFKGVRTGTEILFCEAAFFSEQTTINRCKIVAISARENTVEFRVSIESDEYGNKISFIQYSKSKKKFFLAHKGASCSSEWTRIEVEFLK